MRRVLIAAIAVLVSLSVTSAVFGQGAAQQAAQAEERPQPFNVRVNVEFSQGPSGEQMIKVEVDPWKAPLEVNQGMHVRCFVENVEHPRPCRMLIPRDNYGLDYPLDSWPPGQLYKDLPQPSRGLRPDTTVGQAYPYQIIIPYPIVGVTQVLIDPEYERKR